MTIESVLLVLVIVALTGNAMVSFQIRDRLDQMLAELKKGK